MKAKAKGKDSFFFLFYRALFSFSFFFLRLDTTSFVGRENVQLRLFFLYFYLVVDNRNMLDGITLLFPPFPRNALLCFSTFYKLALWDFVVSVCVYMYAYI